MLALASASRLSYRARLVVRAIDDAENARARHPTFFAAALRNDRDPTCLSFNRAVDRYRRDRRPAAGSRTDHDEVERVDRGFEEAMARRREDRWEKRKVTIDSERRAARRAITEPLELHRLLIERLAKISTVAAGNVEPSRGGGDPAGPPKQQLLSDDPRWQESQAVIRARLERLHELLDEAEGLGTVAGTSAMIGAEKDRLIDREGVGLVAEAVVEKLGMERVGSATYIRRYRKAHNLDNRGYPRPEK